MSLTYTNTRPPETINGYTVIVSQPTRLGLRIILAVRRTADNVEYVTGETYDKPVTEWWWGHYFGTGDESKCFLDAVEDFHARIKEA